MPNDTSMDLRHREPSKMTPALDIRKFLSVRSSRGSALVYELADGDIILSKAAPSKLRKQFYLTQCKRALAVLDEVKAGMDVDVMLASDIPVRESLVKAYTIALSAIADSKFAKTHYIALPAQCEDGWLMFLLPNELTFAEVGNTTGPFCYVDGQNKVFMLEHADGPDDIVGTKFERPIATMKAVDIELPYRCRPLVLGEPLAPLE